MGNTRLVDGPEDGTEVDLNWPFPQEIRRGHDGKVLVYSYEGEQDGRMVYRHAGQDKPGEAVTVDAEPAEGEG